MKTLIISGFPGIGKSHFFRNAEDRGLKVSDSDSSKFDKSKFPDNYINHIQFLIGKKDVILVSCHEDVRKAMKDADIDYTLVYPSSDNKDEYIQRYKDRGSPEAFVNLLESKWDEFISSVKQDPCDNHAVLAKGQFLSDIDLLNQ